MQVSTNTLKKKTEIRTWYHFNDKNRRHTKYRSQKQKACMKENLSERYASLCNTNNFYQMESSELAFPPQNLYLRLETCRSSFGSTCTQSWADPEHFSRGGGVCEEYLSFPGGSKIFSVCVILYYVNLTNLNFPGEGGGGGVTTPNSNPR